MKKTLLAIFYTLAVIGFIFCAIKTYPLVWPTEPLWYVVIATALFSRILSTLGDLLETIFGE